jgi:hypothetical protein
MSITALVVVGNQDGVIGYGKGKAFEAEVAVDKVKAAVYLMPMHQIPKSSPHNWPSPSCLWSYFCGQDLYRPLLRRPCLYLAPWM